MTYNYVNSTKLCYIYNMSILITYYVILTYPFLLCIMHRKSLQINVEYKRSLANNIILIKFWYF